MKYYENMYYYGKYALYVLYIIAFLGLWDDAPNYLAELDYYLKVLVSVVLMYFFNPMRSTHEFKQFHRDVAFSAGFFLFASTALTGIKNFAKQLVHL